MAWNPFRRRPSWDGLAGLQEKALTATPAVLDAIRDRGWQPYPLLGSGPRQRIVDAYNTAQSAHYSQLYERSPALRSVVDTITRNVGQLDLRLYEELSEAERQPRPDHPAALSLRYPSEDVTSDQLTRTLFTDRLVYGNAYALIVPVGDEVSLFHLPAHMVEVRGQSLFRAEGYRFRRLDGTWEDFDRDQIMHWRTGNQYDPRIGSSPLDALRTILAEEASLQQAVVELANAGLTEAVWAYRPLEAPPMEKPTADAFGEDLTNQLYRRNRRVVVTQEGTELRSFGVSPRDAQTLEIRKWILERVASAYGVPLGMVGLADNIEEARTQFYADTLPPYCEEYTRFLNHRLLVQVYGWREGCFEFNLDEKHMGDDRLRALTSATGRPVMLTNEARAKINLPPVDGGDELVTPQNVIVGDNPKPSVDVMPIQDPNGPDQDGSYRENPKTLAAAKGLTPLTELGQSNGNGGPPPTPRFPEPYVPRGQGDLERQHRNIDLAKASIQRHYNRLGRSLKAKGAADWARWDREFATDLNALLERIVETEGTIYAARLAGEFAMSQVANYVTAMAEGAADAINTKIREEIRELGADEALAVQDRHIESAGAGLGGQATIWARCEAARQSPGYEQRAKVWVANTERHAQFAGATVPIGDPWPAGFAPGSAPGCRCTASII